GLLGESLMFSQAASEPFAARSFADVEDRGSASWEREEMAGRVEHIDTRSRGDVRDPLLVGQVVARLEGTPACRLQDQPVQQVDRCVSDHEDSDLPGASLEDRAGPRGQISGSAVSGRSGRRAAGVSGWLASGHWPGAPEGGSKLPD